VKELWQLGEFVRRIRTRMRFGDLSRAPLRLLRMQLTADSAECECIARPPDAWDAGLPVQVGQRHASIQALKDAIALRGLLFRIFPDLCGAVIRVYRRTTGGRLELIVAGSVSRDQRAPAAVRSLAMRAKLLGFHFWLDEGVLEDLQPEPEEVAVNS
jgi:hypothetical protein